MTDPSFAPVSPHVRAVLELFESVCGPLEAEAVQPDEPGFSGARVFRCVGRGRTYCLRRWPPGTELRRVRWIHDVVRRVTAGGAAFVPEPIATAAGNTAVCHHGDVYHLEPWMPGRPRLHEAAAPALLEQAIVSTARWHQLAAGTFRQVLDPPTLAPSAVLASRLRRLSELLGRDQQPMLMRLHRSPAAFRELAVPIAEALRALGPRLLRLLRRAVGTSVPLQPVIRDLRCQHFLFVGDRLSGLIDYGAVCVDSVACDLSRLFATLPPLSPAERQRWIDRYAQLRPLASDERRVIDLLEASSVLLSGITWIRRYCEQGEPVDSSPAALSRLRSLVEHIPALPALLDGA